MKRYPLLIMLILSSCSFLARKNCYQYKEQQITGTIKVIPNPDKKSSYWILKTKPFCTTVSKDEELFQAYKNETEIHLVINGFDQYRKFIGRKVVVTGVLYSIHTGYHKRNVLIFVDNIKELK